MDSKERILTTMKHEEPDKVPITELEIEMPLVEEILGKEFSEALSFQMPVISDREMEKKRVELMIECYEKVGFDMFVTDLSAPEGWEPIKKAEDKIVGPWGRVLKLDKKKNQWVPYSTVFDEPEDFEEFNFPNPGDKGWTFPVRYAKDSIGEKMAVATFIRDPFAHAWEIFTPKKFVKWMYNRTEFIEEVMEKLTEFNIDLIEEIGKIGADMIISGGDYCETKGPIVSQKFFEDLIYPLLEKQVKAAHRHEVKFIKHTDGNVTPILGELTEIVDGVHSLDPSAGVDIGEVKSKYGEDLILIGNVSVDNLAENERGEIVEETKDCMRAASPGGGHILSSSNSWAAGAKLENCYALYETGREFGDYPIDI